NRSFNEGGLGANTGMNRPGAASGFASGVGTGANAAIRPGVGADRIGNRNVSTNLGSSNAFGTAGFSGNSVRASSNRGNNSFGGAGAGRGARGGGGGGGRRR